jgi:hypothetical protein
VCFYDYEDPVQSSYQTERDIDEDRTKTLKIALKTVWQKIDPSSHIFKRYPFDPNAPVVPKRKRSRNGRFVPIRRDP